jgi:hypothetical protein
VTPDSERPAALDRLEPFVGEWTISAKFPSDWPEIEMPAGQEPRVTFEWVLDRQYLTQHSTAPDPIPNGLCVIGIDPNDDDAFLQHYYDSRGVTRIYSMTFDGTTWTLTRDTPDFSPLEFEQRFIGTFEDGGSTIRGAWEAKHPGKDWEHDFELVYTKQR